MSALQDDWRIAPQERRVDIGLGSSLRAARGRIRWQRGMRAVSSTFFCAVLLCAVWIGIVRFTLLDLPRWPAMLFPLAWFAGVAIWLARQKVSTFQAARYLDKALSLDERISTCVELLARGRGSTPLGKDLVDETRFVLSTSHKRLPGFFKLQPERWQIVALAGSLLLFMAALTVPTDLDAVRAERVAVHQSIVAELAQVDRLKADVASRQGLTSEDKDNMLAVLSKLESDLQAPGLDRSGMLAALADAEDRLNQVSPGPTSDFAGLLAASLTIQRIAQTGLDKTGVEWDPSTLAGLNDVAKASDAADWLSSRAGQVQGNRAQPIAQGLQRASDQAGSRFGAISKDLADASTALTSGESDLASRALHTASQDLLEASKQLETSQSVESMMSTLDDQREALAQSVKSTAKKQQVGFRRGAVASSGTAQAVEAPTGSPQGGTGQNPQSTGQNADPNSQNGTSARIGQNMPNLSQSSQGNPNGAASPGDSTQAGKSGQNPGTGGAPQGGQNSNQSLAGGGSGTDSGETGTMQGPISGPVGGVSGAISKVENPAGQGQAVNGSSAGGSSPSAAQDQVYVPVDKENTNTGADPSGTQSPQDPNAPGLEGSAAGDGTNGSQTGTTSAGSASKVHTPYSRVIGDYAQRATDALDRVYIPSDAKDYVKQYFTQLSKLSDSHK